MTIKIENAMSDKAVHSVKEVLGDLRESHTGNASRTVDSVKFLTTAYNLRVGKTCAIIQVNSCVETPYGGGSSSKEFCLTQESIAQLCASTRFGGVLAPVSKKLINIEASAQAPLQGIAKAFPACKRRIRLRRADPSA